MNPVIQKIFWCLPPQLRSLAASARGAYLRSIRYSAATERLVQAALEREYWEQTRWEKWQQERLAYLLHRAATRVPYYRRYWEARRRNGDRSSWEELDNWPVLEKDHVHADPRAFVADDCCISRMQHEHTSGTTGKALDLWIPNSAQQTWYALAEARWRQWYNVTRHDRWAIVGGQLITPVAQRRPPFWVWNGALSQLYMSAYHLAPDLIPHYLNALIRYRIRYLLGYTSALYALAQEVLRSQRDDLHMVVAITNAEPIVQHQRETIAAAFHCPVRETYGMSEMVAAASECEHGVLHLWPEAGIVKVVDAFDHVSDRHSGMLVCTGLINDEMPLIRYRVGDRGTLAPRYRQCRCGRSLPILESIEGRIDDVLFTRDGRCIGRLDPIFKSHTGIREAQIIQESFDHVRIRYVPIPGFTMRDADLICKRLRERMGQVEVMLESVQEIPRGANGKFRAVICNIPPAERPTNVPDIDHDEVSVA